jgi:adenine-specific DNA-methyltransferase
VLPIDEAAYLIGSTYAAMLPPDYRSDRGVYYTPPLVVRRLLDAATTAGVDWATCRVLDPACGGGAFLAPVAARMVAALPGQSRRAVLASLAARLRGYEIDPFAAWLSQVFLQVTLAPFGAATADLDPLITVCDSLAGDDTPEFDLVIGNPPYARVGLTPAQRQRYRRSLFGHANLYGLFLDFAVRKTRPHGLIAYVTPTSFLSGEYYKRLRGLLAGEAGALALEFVSERFGIFDDVLQETLLAVYQRSRPQTRARISFIDVGDRALTVTAAGEVALPARGQEPWIVPRSPGAAALVDRLHGFATRLSDWGYAVRTGPLVWNRHKAQLRSGPERGAVPLVWAESVGADGTFSFRATRRNHAPYFALAEGDDWLRIERPCVLVQRTTAKEQARRLIAAELPAALLAEHGAVTVENHLNMLVPIVANPAVDPATLAAFLNSGTADRVFRCISGSVAVSAYELESMPLPAAEAMSALGRLVRAAAPRRQLDEASDAYGASGRSCAASPHGLVTGDAQAASALANLTTPDSGR